MRIKHNVFFQEMQSLGTALKQGGHFMRHKLDVALKDV